MQQIKGASNPDRRTYKSLRKDISPSSDLFGTDVVILDLFSNWVKKEFYFQQHGNPNLNCLQISLVLSRNFYIAVTGLLLALMKLYKN